ncbi:conjugative transfer system coupling protein TraD [Vibrio owensii]|uniref:conjugative transfer system coupling protein TraD n=1 Tax=Vibrio owensii TaxID=696485 RepID=UPI004067887A
MKAELKNDKIENYLREIYELKQARIWLIAGVYFALNGGWLALDYMINGGPTLPDTLSLCGMAVVCCALMVYYRFKQAWPVIMKQNKLCSNHLVVETLDDVRKKTLKDPNRSYLGTGFRYGPEHANSLYRIAALPSSRRDIEVPWYLKSIIKHDVEVTESLGGEPFIMGLADEKPITVRHDIWRNHLILYGLPGTGKSTALKIIALNKLWADPTCLLAVIDPKNTPELREGLRTEMNRQGRIEDFHYFAPANPTQSCVLDCLHNYTKTTEIASRIVDCMPAGGPNADIFKSFCWERVNQICTGMEYVCEKITLIRIRHYMREGLVQLVEACMRRYYEDEMGEQWESTMQGRFTAISKDKIEAWTKFYTDTMAKDRPNSAVSGIIDLYTQNPDAVRAKTGSLNALLEQLCSPPLDRLLSPSEFGIMDNDPKVVNMRDLSNTGGVLYMATDGLTDPILSAAVSKLASSAVAASSAERYNFGDGNEPEVCFMVDEAHNAINNSIIDLLAIGRQSKYQLILSTQNLPDMINKVGKDAADRITGLCASTICLRVEDDVTKEFVSKKFNQADLNKEQSSIMNGSHSSEGMADFSSGVGMRVSTEERPLLPTWALSSLPNLQAVCSLSNGDKMLLRLSVEPRR